MDAMKEALKRKIGLMKNGPKLEIEIGLGDDNDPEDGSDLAPSIDSHQAEGINAGDDPSMPPGADPHHMEIMKAISDGGSSGKAQGGLHARAADAAKGKMAAMFNKKGMK